MSALRPANNGLHVAIIMDGNGRWAVSRGLARSAGHREGAQALRRTVEAAPDLGIEVLSVYAFSADNWSRSREEVRALMRLFGAYLRRERASCVENGVRLSVFGRRDRLTPGLVRDIERTERETSAGATLHLRVAIDYSARDALWRAATRADARRDRAAFERALAEVHHAVPPPPVDLLIRTGDELRLSDFMLWECAYAELYFTATMWPDFTRHDLAQALAAFGRRERRFGRAAPLRLAAGGSR